MQSTRNVNSDILLNFFFFFFFFFLNLRIKKKFISNLEMACNRISNQIILEVYYFYVLFGVRIFIILKKKKKKKRIKSISFQKDDNY